MSILPKDPNGVVPAMNILFAEWLAEHVADTDTIGRIARYVRDNGIRSSDASFPVWRDYESLKSLKPKGKKRRLKIYHQGDPIPSIRHLFT